MCSYRCPQMYLSDRVLMTYTIYVNSNSYLSIQSTSLIYDSNSFLFSAREKLKHGSSLAG